MCIHCHGRGRSENAAEKEMRHARGDAFIAAISLRTDNNEETAAAASQESLAALAGDARANSPSYCKYLEDVIMKHRNRLSPEELRACADYVTDYAGERWNGLKDPESSQGPVPNAYEPMPLPFAPLNVPAKPSRDPPETLKELAAVEVGLTHVTPFGANLKSSRLLIRAASSAIGDSGRCLRTKTRSRILSRLLLWDRRYVLQHDISSQDRTGVYPRACISTTTHMSSRSNTYLQSPST